MVCPQSVVERSTNPILLLSILAICWENMNIADKGKSQAEVKQVGATILLWDKLTPPGKRLKYGASIKLHHTHWLKTKGRAESAIP